jgi:hypothetical protein
MIPGFAAQITDQQQQVTVHLSGSYPAKLANTEI